MTKVNGYANSSRWYLDRWLAEKAALLPAGSLVLDAGAGSCPYRPLFAHTRYETADFCQVDERHGCKRDRSYGTIDYVCPLHAIPVADQRYDCVICTQVLEHVPDPAGVLRELQRTLKVDGILYLTAPLFYEEHEQPFDFYRYTQFGLQHLLHDCGFATESVAWLEGYYGTLAHQLGKAGRWLPRRPADFGGGWQGWIAAAIAVGLKPALRLLSRWFAQLDVRHKFTRQGQCMNYAIAARKLPPGVAKSAA